MNKVHYLSIIILLSHIVPAFAQKHDYVNTFARLELQLQKGDKNALKSVGLFLDDIRQLKERRGGQTTLHHKALNLLSKYTLFTQQEFAFNKHTTRTAFLSFYLQQESKWIFSDFLQVFMLIPLSKVPYKYRVRSYLEPPITNRKVLFRHYKKEFLQAVNLKLYNQVPEIIERIACLKLPAAFTLLKKCINGRYWKITAANTFAMRLYEASCYALRHYSSIEAAQLIIKTIKQEKTYLQGAIEALSYITNVHPEAFRGKSNDIVAMYNQLVSQYPAIDKLKDKGYKELFDYDKVHFQYQVDYYGTILNKAYHYFWIRYNAIEELKRQKNPKTLWYLAAQVFQNKGRVRYNWQIDIRPLEVLKALTRAEVEVTNAQGQWTSDLTDNIARLNFVRYWYTHYQDYEWDNVSKRFVNRQLTLNINTQRVGFHKQFKRLHNLDQSIAAMAFRQLADKQPEHTLNLLPKQKKIIFPHSDQLPVYPYLSLSVLIKLRTFCQSNLLDYSPYLDDILNKLLPLEERLPQARRIVLENELLELVDFRTVTALEYWAIVRENASWRLGYSLGNVLNRFYNEKRTSLFEHPKYLRLFLKKCVLFAQLRPKGLGADYMSFLKDINDIERKVLDQIWEKEHDQDIKIVIARLNCHPLFSLHKAFTLFVSNPHAKQWSKLRGLKVCSSQDFKKVVAQIKHFQNPEKIHWLLYWLKQQKSIESVPYLMQLIDDKRVIGQHRGFRQYIPLTVSDKVVFLLEQIYHHSFIDEKDFYKVKPRNVYRFSKNIKPWKQKWAAGKLRFRNWETDFFRLRLMRITKQPYININALNNIMLSPLFKPEILKLVLLKSLSKISPKSDIAYLHWKLPLRVGDLRFFKKKLLQPQLLARLIPLIDAKPVQILDFIMKASSEFSEESQARLYLVLGQKTELWQWLYSVPKHSLKEHIVRVLSLFKNIEESQVVRQEIKAVLFHLVNADLSMKEKIKKIGKISDKDLQFETLRQLVLQIRYNKVLALINNIPRLQYTTQSFDALNTQIKQHLLYNLGLPLNDTQNLLAPSLKKDFRGLSKKVFFDKYISKWYPLLVSATKRGDLTYLQAKLKYALAFPLAGIGKNDKKLYALINLFQLSFKTRLGFPENMYSAQSWNKPISVQKWQKHWLHFLKKKTILTNKKSEKY